MSVQFIQAREKKKETTVIYKSKECFIRVFVIQSIKSIIAFNAVSSVHVHKLCAAQISTHTHIYKKLGLLFSYSSKKMGRENNVGTDR